MFEKYRYPSVEAGLMIFDKFFNPARFKRRMNSGEYK